MKLVSGSANRPLAEAIATYVGQPLTQTSFQTFRDKEVFVEILENVRGGGRLPSSSLHLALQTKP